MKLRELFFSTQKYILQIISKEYKVTEIKGKITASTGQRDVSYCYNNMSKKDIDIAIIDALCCLRKNSVKSVKIELTIHLISSNKILFSDYIKAEDVDLSNNFEWEAFLEKEVFSRKDKRKLIHILEEIM